MNPEVEEWVRSARQAKATMEQLSQEFQNLSDTYSPMRNVGFKNDEKEAIDTAYTELYEAKQALCAIQAGGKRSSRSSKRNRKQKRKTRKARA